MKIQGKPGKLRRIHDVLTVVTISSLAFVLGLEKCLQCETKQFSHAEKKLKFKVAENRCNEKEG